MADIIEDIIDGYVECALWASYDNREEDGGTPLDSNYDRDDIAEETMVKIREDCRDFLRSNRTILDQWLEGDHADGRWNYVGHDLFLTRNYHGAGFWDRYLSDTPLGKIGDILTEKAHALGSDDWYVGDDGKIYNY